MLDLRRMLPLVPALLRAVSNYWSFEPEKLGQELLVNHGSLNHLILIWECQFSLFPDVAKSQIPLGHLLPQLPTEWSIRIDFNPLSPSFWTIFYLKKTQSCLHKPSGIMGTLRIQTNQPFKTCGQCMSMGNIIWTRSSLFQSSAFKTPKVYIYILHRKSSNQKQQVDNAGMQTYVEIDVPKNLLAHCHTRPKKKVWASASGVPQISWVKKPFSPLELP